MKKDTAANLTARGESRCENRDYEQPTAATNFRKSDFNKHLENWTDVPEIADLFEGEGIDVLKRIWDRTGE